MNEISQILHSKNKQERSHWVALMYYILKAKLVFLLVLMDSYFYIITTISLFHHAWLIHWI